AGDESPVSALDAQAHWAVAGQDRVKAARKRDIAMAQQDFLGRIRRWFSGPSDTYFFGLQIAIKSFGEDTVRARFAHVLEDEREADEDVQEKRRLLRRF